MDKLNNLFERIEAELIGFTQELVKIRSYTGEEKQVIGAIEKKMKELGYDEVIIDSMGNILGRMGDGDTRIMFDSHVDTVKASEEDGWKHPPFGAVIDDGVLYGRGSVDMKSGATASIYAGYLLKEMDCLRDKTVYISCSVSEEDCDGENLKSLFSELEIKPDYYITCEPSDNKVVTGHKGKAQIVIKTHGVSAHGSAPEKGINAIYEMAEIIQRVESLNEQLSQKPRPRGTVVMSDISAQSVSLNAVPSQCEVYVDRRMVIGETFDTIKSEMDRVVKGKRADWEVDIVKRLSWTGKEINYRPLHLPWSIEENDKLLIAANKSYENTFGVEPEYDYWDFSTNAVTPVEMGISSIGFGPGEYKLAHMVNECCAIESIKNACRYYTNLVINL